MKIFDNKKTSSHFVELLDAMNSNFQRIELTNRVKDLYWRKTLSDEGEYDVYKVTLEELQELATAVNKM